jgi:Transglycosylase SLT domain
MLDTLLGGLVEITLNSPPTQIRAAAHTSARAIGYDNRQWQCLDTIIRQESNWRPKAQNKHSSAYGIGQMLKMKPGTHPQTQIDRVLAYVRKRYGTACKALQFHNKHRWY